MLALQVAKLHLQLVEGPLAGLQLTTEGAERYQVGRTRSTKANIKKLQIKDPDVSQEHAELVWQAGQWSVRDLGSTNGTQLNGMELESRGKPHLALEPVNLVQKVRPVDWCSVSLRTGKSCLISTGFSMVRR